MGIVVFVIVKQLLILSFLTNYLGINVAIAGALTTSILIFDILTDPIIGYLSDRTVSRWGRRAPWMAIGALLLALGQIGIFGVPNFASQLSTLIWVAVFFAISTLGFTMVAIPYGASAGEMTNEPKERSSLMGFRMACQHGHFDWWRNNPATCRRHKRRAFLRIRRDCAGDYYRDMDVNMGHPKSAKGNCSQPRQPAQHGLTGLSKQTIYEIGFIIRPDDDGHCHDHCRPAIRGDIPHF